ncbi:M28 family metallopeptidase [Aquisphaera insulae]|uniref:M28 family metallopeptidase n=1 Tax=Aquisphaera insulae TaxID=2712864 RepID=UPI00202EC2F5|nr:M28 family metallopeptidase [Aquisphaera insulae]
MPDRRRSFAPLIAVPMLFLGGAVREDTPIHTAADSIRPERILEHIKVLSDDAFEGRGPGTPGEEKTVEYLTGQLRAMGLKPGNPDGSFLQNVPLIGFQATRVSGSFRIGDTSIALEFPRNLVAVPGKPGEQPRLDGSDVVFVGYGVEAPEYGWDDFKGLDAKGKTLIMLVGDPPIPDPKDPAQLDPAMFKGRAMTYYGRWTYKYEIAAAKGAAAVLLVHETGPAGYPFSVVQGSWSRENFDIVDPKAGQTPKVDVKGWIDLATAQALCKATGKDYADLKAKALSRDFRPVELGAKANIAIEARSRLVQSHNVIARLEGSDPALKDEYVIFTAHWDHLGRDPELKGDQIYNGAADNASGSAAVLELARAATKLTPAPKRSLLFLFVTAEEKGLLGSKYYATNPLYPLTKTLADINLDVINLWGKTSDLISIGMGQSTLDDLLVDVAREHGRTVGPDAEPEKGYYYRSDHFEFAKQGVPALDPKAGKTFPGKPDDYGKKKADEYTEKDYHKVSDEIKPDWNLAGAAEDLGVVLEIGYRVAQGDVFPEWKPGSEFRARREAMLRPAPK